MAKRKTLMIDDLVALVETAAPLPNCKCGHDHPKGICIMFCYASCPEAQQAHREAAKVGIRL